MQDPRGHAGARLPPSPPPCRRGGGLYRGEIYMTRTAGPPRGCLWALEPREGQGCRRLDWRLNPREGGGGGGGLSVTAAGDMYTWSPDVGGGGGPQGGGLAEPTLRRLAVAVGWPGPTAPGPAPNSLDWIESVGWDHGVNGTARMVHNEAGPCTAWAVDTRD